MTHRPIKSSFPSRKSATQEDELFAMRKKAWHVQGVLNIDPESVHNWDDKQILINIGNRVYGERK